MGQTKEQKVLKQLSGGTVQKKTAIATDMFLPNHSGDHSAGIVNSTPTKDTDIVNKAYVDGLTEGIWEVDGTETQLITADEIDMQTKKIINLADPTANQDAATKKYHDDNPTDITGKANIALDNLASVAINESLVSDTNNTDNLGSTTKGWKDLQLRNQAFIGGVTATGGTWDVSDAQLSQWKLNDNAATTTVLDTEGVNDGTLTTNTDIINIAGILNGAFDFSGSNDYVAIPYTAALAATTRTVSAWFWGTSAAAGMVLEKGRQYMFEVVGGQIRMRVGKNAVGWWYGAFTDIIASGWNHAVGVSDGNSHKFYLNGNYIDEATSTQVPPAENTDLRIGYGSILRNYFNGYVDEVRFFNRVLTQTEITGLYNAGTGTEADTGGATEAHQVIATTATYTSSHGLDTLKDLAIEGELEVNGVTFLDDDLFFTGAGSGLPYGEMYYHGAGQSITCTTQNVWYQVPFATAGISNLTTISTANDDITIAKTGAYQTRFHTNVRSATASDFEISLWKNNGATELVPCGVHLTTIAGAKVVAQSAGALSALTANDTVEMWVRCTSGAGKVLTFEHNSLNVTMIGG